MLLLISHIYQTVLSLQNKSHYHVVYGKYENILCYLSNIKNLE